MGGRIRVALIGAGSNARNRHAPIILENPMFHLKAVWSRTKASADSLNVEIAGRSLQVYHGEEGFEAMLENDALDGFVVALPVMHQTQFVVRLIQKRKHLLSETPIAPDLVTAGRMINTYKEVKDSAVWMVAEHWRYEAALLYMKKLKESIGTVLCAQLTAVRAVDAADKHRHARWRTEKPLYTGGWMTNMGVQYIAALRTVLGDVCTVNASLGEAQPKDTFCGSVEFHSGAVATFLVSLSCGVGNGFVFHIWGTGGHLVMELDQRPRGVLGGYTVKRDGHSPELIPFSGSEAQLTAWGNSINGKERCGPFDSIRDLTVVTGLLQSDGMTISVVDNLRE